MRAMKNLNLNNEDCILKRNKIATLFFLILICVFIERILHNDFLSQKIFRHVKVFNINVKRKKYEE